MRNLERGRGSERVERQDEAQPVVFPGRRWAVRDVDVTPLGCDGLAVELEVVPVFAKGDESDVGEAAIGAPEAVPDVVLRPRGVLHVRVGGV